MGDTGLAGPVGHPETIPAPPPPRTFTAQELAARIEKQAGVTITSRLMAVTWFPRRSALEVQQQLALAPDQAKSLLASLGPTRIEAGKPCPVAPGRTVFDMFEDADEIRIYAIGSEVPPALIRLSKVAPIFTLREMTLDTFVDEVAEELSEVEDEMTTAEKERDAIVEYGASLVNSEALGTSGLYPLSDFLQDIDEGKHLESPPDGDDDELEETDKAPEASAAPPAGGAS